jgi:excisionase family DNA binding protein
MEKLWTIVEVARCLGVTEDDVKQLVRQGQLTGYKLGGQFLRFRPDQVEALKGHVAAPPPASAASTSSSPSWATRLRDALYFYDFYLVSGGLLVVLSVYLVISQ